MFGLSAILGFVKLLIDPVSSISGKIADYKIAQQNATTDQEKIHADERIKALEAKRDVLVAEANMPGNILMRAWLAFPPSCVVAKILIWDKALGQWTHGHTDALDPNLWWLISGVYGFYFLQQITNRLKG